MAESNAHKLGQLVGDLLELAIHPHLAAFAKTHGLFLDQKGSRASRASKKVSWADINGNSHDLDFVLERGGSPTTQGAPVAFIEIAWRRYTKHSRAKAQEIQGAIEPLVEKYRQLSPFKGVVIAGVFTGAALEQLRSLGYSVVFIDYAIIVAAFAGQGVDLAYDEATSERVLGQKLKACRALSEQARLEVANAMISATGTQLVEFLRRLEQAVSRKVTSVRILGLFGTVIHVTSIADAVAGVQAYVDKSGREHPFVRYELRVEFSNNDWVEGCFSSKDDAVAFLRRIEP